MRKTLLEDDSSDSDEAGAELEGIDLKVNQDYARKFEHNKKREEKQRLEDKYGKSTTGKRKRDQEQAESSSEEESSSEDEDEGELATEALDSEIIATINAIRSKDPRVYDSNAKFYSVPDENETETSTKVKKEKPLHLRDYHRQNLLNGATETEGEEPLTYDQEQAQLKNAVVAEMHAAAEDSDASEEGFLKAKSKPKRAAAEVELDVENADKDPETFLSNFMSSRAWAYPTERQAQPFDSDDEEEDRRADEFEEAYNLRFEDPDKSNEKLKSHARDMAAKYSVRRDDVNPRQKKREAEKAAKEAAKQQIKEEKARLRKLRVDEVEEKVRKIKDAAGLRTKDLQPEDWQHFVDEDWDDDRWDEEMQKRFGETYYAEEESYEDSGDEQNGATHKKPKKPKFDDDLDIKDIIPDFEDEAERREFSLSDEDQPPPKKQKQKQTKDEKKRDAKKERRIIEQLVEDQLQMELNHSLPKSNKNNSAFRYRETSPKSFGLSSTDILLADDSQLNQFAGLKKLAAFRDAERKRKDQKHLGKKARLRQWRKDVFGNEEGLAAAQLVPSKAQLTAGLSDDDNDVEGGVNIVDGEKKKKKRRKSKKQQTEVAV